MRPPVGQQGKENLKLLDSQGHAYRPDFPDLKEIFKNLSVKEVE